MADVVIVVGARRGREPVPVAEIRQMAGRAGRRHGGLACEAHVLVDAEDVSRMEDGLEGGDKFQKYSPSPNMNVAPRRMCSVGQV